MEEQYMGATEPPKKEEISKKGLYTAIAILIFIVGFLMFELQRDIKQMDDKVMALSSEVNKFRALVRITVKNGCDSLGGAFGERGDRYACELTNRDTEEKKIFFWNNEAGGWQIVETMEADQLEEVAN